MTQGNIKPWSQIDDEPDEREAAGRPTAALHDAVADVRRGRANAFSPGLGGKIAWLRITPYWALPPLAAAFAWIGYGMLRSAGQGTGLAVGHAIGALALILAGGGVLVAAMYARKAALAGIREAIARDTRRLPAELADLPVAAELQPFYQAVEQHTGNIERRVAELLDAHQQLSLEMSMSETNRRQAETIIDSIAEPILVTDAYDRLVLANPAAASLLQFAREEALRKPIAEIVPDEKLVRAIRQAREADIRAANRSIEHEVGPQTYAVRFSPLLSEGSQTGHGASLHGVVAMFRNITKEREASKNKSEFVAHAAHELRTPLSSIRAYVEMLVDGEAEDEKTRKEYYNIIQVSADRLGRMIDNILNISRIEAGTVRINKEPVAISMIVKEAIDVARPQAEEKGIALSEELTPVVYRVMADRDMMYQAVLNLLSNAIKYTPSGGKVQVRMSPEEEDSIIRIEVSDNGVGIPKEDLPRMFEKFFRVEANKKMAKGTGLGLNLVKHIVETIHEGKMTLTSEVGKGSAFGMNLPLMA
ncbi:MAG TPA: ATP-binding protein [Phycisphaerae bacterium]|nr:ATP-binding protein [Phycisphaerae bacterium]